MLPLALIVIGVAARLALNAYNYEGISLYCGDSASYYGLAQNLSWATADRPSGFPFFLRALLEIDSSPAFLLAVTIGLSIGAQLLFWRVLRPYVSPRVGFVLNLLVFLNPVYLKISSMVFMADTLSYFLLGLALLLLLSGGEGRRLHLRNVLALVVLGYLAIVKNAFVYFAPVVWLYLLIVAARRRLHTAPLRLVAVACVYAGAFAAIPAWYAFDFNGTRMHTVALESFSGRSLLSNLLAQASCDEFRDAAADQHAADIVARRCRDELLSFNAGMLLWDPASVVNEIEADLLDHHPDRVAGNRILGAMAVRLAVFHPTLVVRAVVRNVRAHLGRLWREQESVDQLLNLDPGCADLIRELFHLEPDEYARRWRENAHRAGLPRVETVDWIARRYADAVELVAFAGLLMAMAITPWRWRQRPELVLVVALSLIYLGSISVGSYYNPRVYVALNVLAYAAAVIAFGRGASPALNASTE